MLRSRGIVRTARTLTVCLIAVVVCPAFGEIAALASGQRVSCSSAHACCRRAGTTGACPHQMPPAAHDARCRGSICVLTCNDPSDAAIVPIVLIGFSPASLTHTPRLVLTTLAAVSIDVIRSIARVPLTPPPRTLPA